MSYKMVTTCFLFLTIQLSLLSFSIASSPSLLCPESERSALLEFKISFFNKTPYYPSKLESWKLEVESGNCCAWAGIECDTNSGHVIGVELRDSCLSGNLNSNTSLFYLVHLQRLDLSGNALSGQIPPEILKMTNLSSLDMSYNVELELKKPSLLDLVQDLTKLENLNLAGVNISTPIPNILAKLLPLRSLELTGCNLQGEFPSAIFKMPKLENLDVGINENLSGHLPKFHWRSSLKSLSIYKTNFSGHIPSSLGNLASLNALELGYNNFIGQIPSSIGNLTQLSLLDLCCNLLIGEIPFRMSNLTQLTALYLYKNQLTGAIPSCLGQLSNLERLDLSWNKLTGEVPSSFVNLTQLTKLALQSNQFSGQLFPWLTKLTQLSDILLSYNNFSGSIPSSIAKIKDLAVLDLRSNKFSGTVWLSMFLNLKFLHVLRLSSNKFIFIDDLNSTKANLGKFESLCLASCSLSIFPRFLQDQDQLIELDLSNNNLSGEIPYWFLEMSIDQMKSLNLSSNLLTSSSHRPLNFRWKHLVTLDLRDNNLEGPLPTPPTSIIFYLLSRNKLSGNLPQKICELGSIEGLDLSENKLTGVLPDCFDNVSETLSFLSLRNNNFRGQIPSIGGNGDCYLDMIDLSNNQFQGILPRSLSKCYGLEFLNVGGNYIEDVFPSWLGSLPNLKVLILHFNNFHGAIRGPETSGEFHSLQIIDLSSNNFNNCLPSMYFESWHAMMVPISYNKGYMERAIPPYIINWGEDDIGTMYDFTFTIFIKGVRMSYPKIQDYLTFIDFSNNNFSCEIPSTVEGLSEVQYLNFSRNNLVGPVPLFLKTLTQLEALDLSYNKLGGKIPLELTQLTFLGTFNVSYNNLSGRIPEGRQFDTYNNDSYFGNVGLCGLPLSKKCGDVEAPPLRKPQPESEGEESVEIDWKVVLMGYGSGLVIGAVIGQIFTLRPPHWMLKYFGRRAYIR